MEINYFRRLLGWGRGGGNSSGAREGPENEGDEEEIGLVGLGSSVGAGEDPLKEDGLLRPIQGFSMAELPAVHPGGQLIHVNGRLLGLRSSGGRFH